ncbi:MAG: hypothetical protein U1E37_01880 [Sphingomonadaceae bacterium]
MNIPGGKARIAGALALLMPLVPMPASAQTSPIFTIPTARPTSNPRAQGPVDEENPVVRASPRPSPTPVPTLTPVPAATSSAPPPPVVAAPRPAPRQTQAQTQTARPQPAPTGQPTPAAIVAPASQAAASVPAAQPTFAATDSPALPAPATPAPAAAPGWYWPWIAGAAGLLAALFALLWWRRRRAVPLLAYEPPVVVTPEATPRPAPSAKPAPVPTPPRPSQPVAAASGLGISLEARRLNASLMATTLSYTLRLTNQSGESLSALAVEGDMISAHASLPPERQIAGASQRLELRHALVTLAPGESAEFTGDFRLPLSAITPIRAGEAAYFVPLARLRIEASQPSGAKLVEVQTFVIGEQGEAPGAALRPFRLDLGPRTFSRLGQRAVS